MLKQGPDGVLIAVTFVLAMFGPQALPAGASPQAASTQEDPDLRARAVGLLEHAVQLSSPVWPMNEQVFTFHIPNPEPGAATEGSLRLGIGAPALKRWEFVYGAYQLSQVLNGTEYATYRTGPEPAAVVMVRKILPVSLPRFDESDIIRSITDKTVDGTPAACIDFETIAGTRHQFGTVCVDKTAGYLIFEKVDDLIIKQSKFYAFNNGFLPGHIERWTGATKLAEIEEHIEVRTQFPPNYFDYPAGATISPACNSFTHAYAQNTPQPPAKSFSDGSVDIAVHGFVGKDGRPTGLTVLDGTHRDLAEEAVKIVSAWTFHPAQCNYQPANDQRDFIVHFQGWQ
jgi:hypothetical protein